MSKKIPYVADIQLESPQGDPFFRLSPCAHCGNQAEDATIHDNGKSYMISQIKQLREAIQDPAFIAGMDPVAGEELRFDTRRMLRIQEKEAPVRGFWLIDFTVDPHSMRRPEESDDAYQRLLNATTKPMGKPHALSFNQVPFFRAVKSATTPAAEEAKPATNGASAQPVASASAAPAQA